LRYLSTRRFSGFKAEREKRSREMYPVDAWVLGKPEQPDRTVHKQREERVAAGGMTSTEGTANTGGGKQGKSRNLKGNCLVQGKLKQRKVQDGTTSFGE